MSVAGETLIKRACLPPRPPSRRTLHAELAGAAGRVSSSRSGGDSGFSCRLHPVLNPQQLRVPLQSERTQQQKQQEKQEKNRRHQDGPQHRHHGEPAQRDRNMYDHPRHPLRARTDLRRSGLDPGGVHAGDTAQPSGMGHVRLRLLLHHDLHLGGGVRLRRPSKQRPLGCRRLHLPRHRRLLLPQCFSGFGRRHPGDNRQELPELQAGRLRSGVLVRGDASLLLPHHPVGPSMEVFLEASEPTTQPIPKLRRADGVLPEEAVKKHLDHHGVSLRSHRNSSAVITDVAPHVSRFDYILKKCLDNTNQRRRSTLNVSWRSYRFVHSLILYCALCASFEDPRCRFCSFALVQWCNLEFL